MTHSAFRPPNAKGLVPSRGSTATSHSGPDPLPTCSPIYSIGASSISPSPITTRPAIGRSANILRIAAVAAASACCLFPRPTQGAQLTAAAAVTPTNASACSDKMLSPPSWFPLLRVPSGKPSFRKGQHLTTTLLLRSINFIDGLDSCRQFSIVSHNAPQY